MTCFFWFLAGTGKQYLRPKAAAKSKPTYAEVAQKAPADEKKPKKKGKHK